MRFLKAIDLWVSPPAQWHALPEPKETVVTVEGQPLAILSAFDESQMADALTAFRRDHTMEAFVAIQYRSIQTGANAMPPAKIDMHIQSARDDISK